MPLAVVAVAVPHHAKGCRTRACDERVGREPRIGRRWWRKHHRFHFTTFELCVANQESGQPGSTSYASIEWRYSRDYEGAYNWTNSTWLAMGGGRYAAHAYEASPEQQTLIFRSHANSHDWPNSVPACGG